MLFAWRRFLGGLHGFLAGIATLYILSPKSGLRYPQNYGVLLLAGLAMKKSQRLVATIMLTVGSVAAATAWWVIYTVVFAAIVVIGGLWAGKIGSPTPQPEPAV